MTIDQRLAAMTLWQVQSRVYRCRVDADELWGEASARAMLWHEAAWAELCRRGAANLQTDNQGEEMR